MVTFGMSEAMAANPDGGGSAWFTLRCQHTLPAYCPPVPWQALAGTQKGEFIADNALYLQRAADAADARCPVCTTPPPPADHKELVCVACGSRYESADIMCVMSDGGEGVHDWIIPDNLDPAFMRAVERHMEEGSRER